MNVDITTITENMPNFQNHEEARTWFMSHFQDSFVYRTHDEIEGKMVYYYHIVKNPDVYQRYMASLASEEKHEITNMETFESYTTVEISEDGEVSITT